MYADLESLIHPVAKVVDEYEFNKYVGHEHLLLTLLKVNFHIRAHQSTRFFVQRKTTVGQLAKF